MNLGTGGADANLATMASAVRGFEAWGVNARMFFGEQEEGRKYAGALRTLYSGGGTKREAFEDILSGRTNVLENGDGDYRGKTTYDEVSGTKTLRLGKDALADGSRFGLNILFAHEAYRDGIDNGALGQLAETDRAVLGHIDAAKGLAGTYGFGAIGNAMAGEVIASMIAERSGDVTLLNKVLAGYDSSKDYWRVLKDKDGKVTKVLDDGDRENATIVEADGTERKVKLQSGSVSGAIAAAVGNGMTQEQMNKIMASSGLDWTKEKGWYAKDESAKYTAPVAPIAEQSALDKVSAWTTSKLEQVGSWLSSRGTEISRFFGWNTETPKQNEATKTTFEIASKNGEPITLYNIGSDNPILSQLVKQSDPAFSDIPDITEGGCNFRVVQAYCELLAGKALTADQVKQIWKETAGTSIMDSDGFVKKADNLADKTLAALGRTDFGLTFGADWRKNGTLVGYRIGMPYGSGSHYTLGDTFKNLIYNPGNTYAAANDWRNVYVYPKK